MSTSETEKVRCANFACKCHIEPSETVCSDYCAAAERWSSEVQTEVCACGHPDCSADVAAPDA